MTFVALLDRSRHEPEDWRYTNLEKLIAKAKLKLREAQPSFSPPSSLARFVFVDGILSLADSSIDDLPRDVMQGDATSGYCLKVAGETCLITQPIELLFRLTANPSSEVNTKLKIELGASARLTLIERHDTSLDITPGTASIIETTINLAAQAKLVHGKLVEYGAIHLAESRVSIAEGAYYDNFTLIAGGNLIRNEIHASINGPLAQCALNGVMLLDHDDHADTLTRVVHLAPHGSSQQYYKTIAAGHSRGIFQGKVVVAKHAQKTESKQLSRALLLSDQAEVDAKPELEIFADDVKCSHGSTVGDLDADALFYARARGINEGDARAMLMRAFAEDAIDQIHVPEWRDIYRTSIERWLNERS